MDPKAVAREAVDRARDALVDLSHRIHAHPELKFEEERAAEWIGGTLTDAGHGVDTGICDLPTAFSCTIGSGPLHVAICAEYDALPAIGHACGHNIIAAAAVGAGLALAPVVDGLGLTVEVIGTPGEESGGGKVYLLERGAFDGVHAALMVHPCPVDALTPNVIATHTFDVGFTGREAHAAAAPERGVNAADAFVIAQVAIGLLRQHLDPADKVHGIVTHGGDAATVVPAHTRGTWMVRSSTIEALRALRPRVERCFEAGALATGSALELTDVSPPYAHMDHDASLVAAYRRNAEALGRHFDESVQLTFSTDMGNVSLAVPSIHPCIGVESKGATIHQPEFAEAAVSESGDRAIVDGAVAMAWTAIDAATNATLRETLMGRAR
jgi:amidohydrolase